jgi:integrase
MANLTVTILVRTTQDGKRVWIPASGKTDPAGSYYIRFCEGSRQRIIKRYKHEQQDVVIESYEDAEIAKLRLERKFKATSQGFIVAEAKPSPLAHRITDVIVAYLVDQAKPDQNGEFKSKKTLNSKKSELEKFAAFCGKTYVEEIDTKVLIRYRDHLNAEDYEPDTVYNKLMDVVTWLKHNKVVPYKPLLEAKDWPDKKDTVPDPYTDEEIEVMISFATADEKLLIRFFAATGMREGEVSVAEREDLDAAKKCVYVRRAKPQYGWKRKNKAATRTIYLGGDLLKALLERGPGLLFPKNGHRNTKILRDIIEPLARKANVTPTTEKKDTHPEAVKNDWLHRFRDTWLTKRVARAKDVNALRAICKEAGHSNLETLDVYAAQRTANDPETRADADAMDTFGIEPEDDNVVEMRRSA